MNILPILPPGTPVLAKPVREPTPEQRLAIRQNLDQYFDDVPGAYLEGWTDHRIAELVGVPRKAVENIREAAYGPIRVNPETQKMANDIILAQKAVDGQQIALDKLKEQLKQLGERVEAIAKNKG